jgi:hypothetical protein
MGRSFRARCSSPYRRRLCEAATSRMQGVNMQVQYIVDFEVRTEDESGVTARSTLVSHVHDWLAYSYVDPPAAEALQSDEQGEVSLSIRPEWLVPTERRLWTMSPEPRHLRWRRVGTPQIFASRFDLRTPVSGGSAFHVTGVTVAVDRAQSFATIRVVMGREALGGWLAPVPLSFVRRPGIVRMVAVDERLRVTTLDQVVDARFSKVYSSAETTVIIESLHKPQRLPMLLVAPAGQRAWDFARHASTELPGLASVVCLASRESRETFEDALPDLSVPFGTARLVWSDLDAFRHPDLTRVQIENDEPEYLVSKLMRMLSPLSVVARGVDMGWRNAERAETVSARREASQRLRIAEERGDQAASIAALKEQITAAERDVQSRVEEVSQLEDEVLGLISELESARDAEYKATHWREMYLDLLRQGGTGDRDGESGWDSAPELSPDDAQPLLDFLEKHSHGHLRFTSDVARGWRKSGYAFPERMRETLIKMAKASLAFAESQGEIPMRLSDWFRDVCDLDVALTDQELKKSGKARFDFEDSANLDGVPHVKLGDGKTPRECGRIYFAYESNPARFVVHHVGIHNLLG